MGPLFKHSKLLNRVLKLRGELIAAIAADDPEVSPPVLCRTGIISLSLRSGAATLIIDPADLEDDVQGVGKSELGSILDQTLVTVQSLFGSEISKSIEVALEASVAIARKDFAEHGSGGLPGLRSPVPPSERLKALLRVLRASDTGKLKEVVEARFPGMLAGTGRSRSVDPLACLVAHLVAREYPDERRVAEAYESLAALGSISIEAVTTHVEFGRASVRRLARATRRVAPKWTFAAVEAFVVTLPRKKLDAASLLVLERLARLLRHASTKPDDILAAFPGSPPD